MRKWKGQLMIVVAGNLMRHHLDLRWPPKWLDSFDGADSAAVPSLLVVVVEERIRGMKTRGSDFLPDLAGAVVSLSIAAAAAVAVADDSN